ncbi:MAG: class I SAM-dependent methyltransferase [Candidatus Sumerlaeia bacterium]|nr:class I SAM-dependent methyltransferase [Candidatus Sumerlaeia bacterium]
MSIQVEPMTLEQAESLKDAALASLRFTCPSCGERLDGEVFRRKASPGIIHFWNEEREDPFACGACGAEYRWHSGVFDLRTEAAPYQDAETERAYVAELVDWSRGMMFPDVVSSYIHTHSRTPVAIKQSAIDNRTHSVPRGQNFLALFDKDSTELGFPAPAPGAKDLGALLDLGCGVCGQLIAARLRAETLVGIDASLTEVFLGRRHLMDHYVPNAVLAAANGERLPFADGSFDTVMMRDVVEHLADQRASLKEIWRILKPGGRFYLNSPNRYMIWTPEPHTGLYLMGFMPRSKMKAHVARKAHTGYDRCRLLGKGELRSMLSALRPRPARKLLIGSPIPGGHLDAEYKRWEGTLQSDWFCRLPLVDWIAPEHRALLVKPL